MSTALSETSELRTIGQAAAVLGVDRNFLGAFIERIKLPTRPGPNPLAKMVDTEGMAVLRRRLSEVSRTSF